jgi:outer membrane lipoprotein-sorting protein
MRKGMGRLTVAVAVVVVFTIAVPAATRVGNEKDDRGEALVKRVVGAYQKISSLSADVVTVYDFGGQKQSMNSKVVVKKPNMFRMTMSGPQAGTFVSNGKAALFYMKSANQYMKMPKEAAGGAAAGAMMGNLGADLIINADALKALSKIEYVGTEVVEGMQCEIVKGELDKSEIKLFIQPDLLIRRTSMKMGEGASSSSMQSTLRNTMVNKAFPASTFVFTPPKGATEMKRPSPVDYDAKLVKVGKPAPNFKLPAPTGGSVSLDDTLKGKKAVLVNFWFYN